MTDQTATHDKPCPFCTLPPERIVARNEHGGVLRDLYPVSPGHTLVIPWRHVGSFFDLTPEERAGLMELVDGAKQALGVALACATAGIVIGIIALTGIGISFTAFIVALAQNSLLLALILTMAAGIILGMGMPTTPAYIIMVSLLVPALIKLGVVQPAAHMFAFYFAILSAIKIGRAHV